jgi:hypothetical protein
MLVMMTTPSPFVAVGVELRSHNRAMQKFVLSELIEQALLDDIRERHFDDDGTAPL